MRAIYKREIASYFTSPIGYIFVAIVLAFAAFYFMTVNLGQGHPMFAYALSSFMIIYVLVIPILTMRSFSEEKKLRTDQMLLTAPVRVVDIVLGKYFAMITVLAVPMVICCIFPLVIKLCGNAYLLTDYSAILALFLLGCTFIAIGMFISAQTESQMIAAAGTFAVTIVAYMWPSIVSQLPLTTKGSIICYFVACILTGIFCWLGTRNFVFSGIVTAVCLCILGAFKQYADRIVFIKAFPRLMENFGLFSHFDNFAFNETFDLAGIIKYLTVALLFIYLTAQSISKKKWN